MVGSGTLQLSKRPGRKLVCTSIQADRPVGAATGGFCMSLYGMIVTGIGLTTALSREKGEDG